MFLKNLPGFTGAPCPFPNKLQNSFLSDSDDIGYLTLTQLKDKIANNEKEEQHKPKKEETKPKKEEAKPKKEDKKEKEENIKPKKVKAVLEK